ncbi:MAG: DUF481 domain-containing protein [Myxococcota bacterium]|nr:DUF481 domain-containing protein [Myxococcota bacterium]
MHRLGFIVFLTILSLQSVWAQEVGLDDGEHLPLFNLRAGFDANYSSGNFEQTRLNGRGVLFKRWGDELAVLNSTRYQYMQNGDIVFSDDFRSVMIVTLNPLNSFQPYFLGLYHKSYTRFIDRRWMSGAGGAYSLLRSKTQQLKFGLAAAYEWTQLDPRAPPFSPPDGYGSVCRYLGNEGEVASCDRQMWRIIPRLASHHEFSDRHLIVDLEALWVIDPEDFSDERVYFSATAAVPLLSWLRLTSHYDLSFESVVLSHRVRLDSHLSFGFQINTSG